MRRSLLEGGLIREIPSFERLLEKGDLAPNSS